WVMRGSSMGGSHAEARVRVPPRLGGLVPAGIQSGYGDGVWAVARARSPPTASAPTPTPVQPARRRNWRRVTRFRSPLGPWSWVGILALLPSGHAIRPRQRSISRIRHGTGGRRIEMSGHESWGFQWPHPRCSRVLEHAEAFPQAIGMVNEGTERLSGSRAGALHPPGDRLGYRGCVELRPGSWGCQYGLASPTSGLPSTFHGCR